MSLQADRLLVLERAIIISLSHKNYPKLTLGTLYCHCTLETLHLKAVPLLQGVDL